MCDSLLKTIRLIEVTIRDWLGGIPYIAASATTVYTAYAAGLAASGMAYHIDPSVALAVFNRAVEFQVSYGAVLLSFLGQCIHLRRMMVVLP